jgi:alpha-amylase
MECYSNTDEIWGRIQGANYNLMALDFDTKWHVFDAIAGWDYNGKYEKARGDGLIGRNNGRYAVTFIDSHDWFLRDEDNGGRHEFGGRGNSLTEAMKPRLLQANAFLLCMPGVPCVFYPHWAKYKEFLKPMIEARKAARVHSESEVKDEYATSTGYQATIVGKDGGYIILCLGDKAHQVGFDGFVLGASYYAENDCGMGHDASYQIWVKKSSSTPTGTEETETSVKAEKIMRNGQLVIRKGDRLYDVTGRVIQ